MTTSLAPAESSRPKPANRPTHPWVLHIEGHLEQLFALDEDEKVFIRGAHVATLIRGAEERCHKILNDARNVAELVDAARIQSQVIRMARRLAEELSARALRLQKCAIPATRECYQAAEQAYSTRSLP